MPTPKDNCIWSKRDLSLKCRVILNEALTPHLFFKLAFELIFIIKHPSASTNPEINQGFNTKVGIKLASVEYFFIIALTMYFR